MVHVRGALAAVLLAVVLTACNAAPEPKVQDQPSPSSTPTAASSAPTSTPTTTPTASGPAEPTLPAAAQEDSDAGAEAFVRYWVELINFGQATGNADTLDSVMESSCAACGGFLRAIREPYASGGRIQGGDWKVGDLRELPLDHDADWAGFAEFTTAPQIVYAGDGSATKYPGGSYQLYAYVAWTSSHWSMRWVRTVTPKS